MGFAAVEREWLQTLCSIPGVSGDERSVAEEVLRLARPWVDDARFDPLGNLILTRHWDGPGPRLVLSAHMDEVGLLVTAIDKDGTLRFGVVGGIDPRILPGVSVRVGAKGRPGVVMGPPIHLAGVSEREQALASDRLRIDIGAADRQQAEQTVSVGDVACFASEPGDLGRLFAARALDDRAGVAAIVSVLRATRASAVPLAVAFTVQEEIGTRGAAAAAQSLRPDIAVVVETTTAADLPEVEAHRQVTRLGRGPALTVQDSGMIASREVTGALRAAAQAAGVAFQRKESSSGGTDGARFAALGARCAVVSLPCRYLHAPRGVMDPDDLDGMAVLLTRWIEDRAATRP